ncbi:unnamed protein product [Didymodactylos carnosus]|uniref:Uncharacterized protein n=1 Tax=Didymodactylos carnosus TaxID=1234261 RepID=A0A813TCE9_9BILA|nr:unnamed protein product [Didymodactylos carnosus]CAF0860587.1 unnamed protein product [Didymodactylos carnosus]CAF3597639.1 unnamed protein product [Didymodactylos carnosus]CAF3645473.1 unnamed protein product [Didymodactylos carnosus]
MARSTFISFDNEESSHSYSLNTKEREFSFNDHSTTGVTSSNKLLHFHHRLMPTISDSSRIMTMPTIISATTQQPIVITNKNSAIPQISISPPSTQLKGDNNYLFNNILESDESSDKCLPITSIDNKIRLNPKMKRNIRGKRRSTGINPDPAVQVFEANSSLGDDDDSQSVNDQIIIRTTSNPDQHEVKNTQSQEESHHRRYLEERINVLETLLLDKDSIIHDLQEKLDSMTRDLSEAEQEIYALHKDKLSLIRALSAIQGSPPTTPSKP